MFKTVLTAAVATLAVAPAMAQAGEVRQFSQDGVNYVYTTEHKGEVTVINGRTSAGAPFRLYVKAQHVTGTFNNHPVNFTHAETDHAGALAAN